MPASNRFPQQSPQVLQLQQILSRDNSAPTIIFIYQAPDQERRPSSQHPVNDYYSLGSFTEATEFQKKRCTYLPLLLIVPALVWP
jgi:hypothetical protein